MLLPQHDYVLDLLQYETGKLTNNLLSAITNNCYSILVLLDLYTAFDTVDQLLLLKIYTILASKPVIFRLLSL